VRRRGPLGEAEVGSPLKGQPVEGKAAILGNLKGKQRSGSLQGTAELDGP
jgi:hypothetical protein